MLECDNVQDSVKVLSNQNTVESADPIVVKLDKQDLAQEVSIRSGVPEELVVKVLDTFVNIQLEHLKVDYL